ncbi:MAG: class IV adenylate cyclase [Melioribacteraceae bacterium]
MTLNLEIKIKLESFNEILVRISRIHIIEKNTISQKDIYYKVKNGLLKLRSYNNNYELIKYNRNEQNGERWSEYSVLKLSGESVENYFNDLFDLEIIVEKVREIFIYKNTRIHLDEVKNLGKFLELETVVKNISQDEAKLEFEKVVKLLNLDVKNQIRKSYRDLILEKSKQKK